MVQLWKSLSLIHYKYLKYYVVDYAFISAHTHYYELGKKHLPSIPVGSAD